MNESSNKVFTNNLVELKVIQQKGWSLSDHHAKVQLSKSRNSRVMMVSTKSSVYMQIRYLQITWVKSKILSRKVGT